MKISHDSLEIILDLIEIKMNALQTHDGEDIRQVNKLRKCKQEFLTLLQQLSLNPLIRERTRSEKSSLRNG